MEAMTKRITCEKCGNKFWQTEDEDGTFDAVCPDCAKPKKKWEKKVEK